MAGGKKEGCQDCRRTQGKAQLTQPGNQVGPVEELLPEADEQGCRQGGQEHEGPVHPPGEGLRQPGIDRLQGKKGGRLSSCQGKGQEKGSSAQAGSEVPAGGRTKAEAPPIPGVGTEEVEKQKSDAGQAAEEYGPVGSPAVEHPWIGRAAGGQPGGQGEEGNKNEKLFTEMGGCIILVPSCHVIKFTRIGADDRRVAMVIFILLSLLAVALLVFMIILRRMGGGSFPWIKFYSKGKDAGFAFSEIHLLRKVAVTNKLKKPTALFWSVDLLDRSIRDIITRMKSQNKEGDPESQDFVGKLYEFRKKIEFSKPKYTSGLGSTREIDPHQKLKITHPDTGTCFSQVVENLRKHLAVAYPKGRELPEGYNWREKMINVYFWRNNDAGYHFQTKVIGDYYDEKYAILHLAHTDNVIRSQKRKSVRVQVSAPASLYKLRRIEDANERVEKKAGLRCRLQDVSEDGASFLIGGRAKVGMAVKLQFILTDKPLILCGVVKGVSYNSKKGQSSLHLQAVPPSAKMRNQILAYVYDIFNEQEAQAKKAAQRKAMLQKKKAAAQKKSQ